MKLVSSPLQAATVVTVGLLVCFGHLAGAATRSSLSAGQDGPTISGRQATGPAVQQVPQLPAGPPPDFTFLTAPQFLNAFTLENEAGAKIFAPFVTDPFGNSAWSFGDQGEGGLASDGKALILSNLFTLSFWYRPGATDGTGIVQRDRTQPNNSAETIRVETNGASGKLRFTVGSHSSGQNLTGTSTVETTSSVYGRSQSPGVWFHVVLTNDFDQPRIYVDGVAEHGAETESNGGFDVVSGVVDQELFLGHRFSTTSDTEADFALARLKIWNERALSASDANQEYRRELRELPGLPAPLSRSLGFYTKLDADPMVDQVTLSTQPIADTAGAEIGTSSPAPIGSSSGYLKMKNSGTLVDSGFGTSIKSDSVKQLSVATWLSRFGTENPTDGQIIFDFSGFKMTWSNGSSGSHPNDVLLFTPDSPTTPVVTRPITSFPVDSFALNVVVYDIENNEIRFYVDDKLVSTTAHAFANSSYAISNHALDVGGTGGFDGAHIDEQAAWYDRALVLSEVLELFNFGSGIPYSTLPTKRGRTTLKQGLAVYSHCTTDPMINEVDGSAGSPITVYTDGPGRLTTTLGVVDGAPKQFNTGMLDGETMSAAIWFKNLAGNVQPNPGVFSLDGSTSNGTTLIWSWGLNGGPNFGGNLTWIFQGGGTSGFGGGTEVSPNEWSLFVMTFDPSSGEGANSTRRSVNGLPFTDVSYGDNDDEMLLTPIKVDTIEFPGNNNGLTNGYETGAAFWRNKLLTDEEVAALWNGGAGLRFEDL